MKHPLLRSNLSSFLTDEKLYSFFFFYYSFKLFHSFNCAIHRVRFHTDEQFLSFANLRENMGQLTCHRITINTKEENYYFFYSN